jgi:hypothetical protein
VKAPLQCQEGSNRRIDLVSFPTTGAIVRDEFYFLANTGIGNLEDGRIVDRAKLEPIHVAVAGLKEEPITQEKIANGGPSANAVPSTRPI